MAFATSKLPWLLVIIRAVFSFTMTSLPRSYTLDSGHRVIFACEFRYYSFSTFYNPVIWIKQQLQEESKRINIQSNINSPFYDTYRFSVTYIDKTPMHSLELLIKDVSVQDTGNYTCEVRDDKSHVMGNVTHTLTVRAPIKQIFFTNTTSEPYYVQRELHFTEKLTHMFGCIALGGYPPPELMVKIGGHLRTEDLKVQSESLSLKGVPGLRLLEYTVIRWTNSFVPAIEDDSSTAWCSGRIPGMSTDLSTLARITVRYAPRLLCDKKSANNHSVNVTVSCTVRARPLPYALHWLLDVSNKTKYLDQTTVLNSTTLIATLIIMTSLEENDFRSYGLLAENSVTASTGFAILSKFVNVTEPTTNQRFIDSNSERRNYYYRIITRANTASKPSPAIPLITCTVYSILYYSTTIFAASY